jgi:hypothetical protein
VFEPGELSEGERAPAVDHFLGGRRPPQAFELGESRAQGVAPLVEQLVHFVLGELGAGGERELDRLGGGGELAPGAP